MATLISIGLGLLVFGAALIVDWLAASWTASVSDKRAVRAALFSACIAVSSVLMLLLTVEDHWLMVPSTIGHAVGSFVAVRNSRPAGPPAYSCARSLLPPWVSEDWNVNIPHRSTPSTEFDLFQRLGLYVGPTARRTGPKEIFKYRYDPMAVDEGCGGGAVRIEDPRKQALKRGLRQLNEHEIVRLITHVEAEKPVLLDRDEKGAANYADGVYCPLAIAVGVPGLFKRPTDELVRSHLESVGLTIYNTRGVGGEFYTNNRREDLLVAAREVLASMKS